MATSPVPARAIWLILIGFTVWSLAFAGLYAAQALGCYAGLDEIAVGPITVHRLLMIALFAITLAVMAWLTLHMYRRRRHAPATTAPSDFLVNVGFYATVAALVASALIFAPVLAVSICI